MQRVAHGIGAVVDADTGAGFRVVELEAVAPACAKRAPYVLTTMRMQQNECSSGDRGGITDGIRSMTVVCMALADNDAADSA